MIDDMLRQKLVNIAQRWTLRAALLRIGKDVSRKARRARPGEKSEFSTREPRTEPYRGRRLCASDKQKS
jgi:hypothetical protein